MVFFCVILLFFRPSPYLSSQWKDWPGHYSKIHLLCSAEASLTDSEQHESNKVNHFWLNCPFKGKMWTAWHFYSSVHWNALDTFGLSNCAVSIFAIVITHAKVCYALCKINTKINHSQSTLCVPVHLEREGEKKERGREVTKYIIKKAPLLIDELDLLFLDANFHL